jgi:hypothetical protein
MPESSPAVPEEQPEIIDADVVDAPPPPLPAPDYDEHGTPSLDYVRNKIEGRFATSVGSTELADETAAGRSLAEQEAERAKKAQEKLDEIRRSLG